MAKRKHDRDMKNFLQNGMYGMLGSGPVFGNELPKKKKKITRPKLLSPLSDSRERIIIEPQQNGRSKSQIRMVRTTKASDGPNLHGNFQDLNPDMEQIYQLKAHAQAKEIIDKLSTSLRSRAVSVFERIAE